MSIEKFPTSVGASYSTDAHYKYVTAIADGNIRKLISSNLGNAPTGLKWSSGNDSDEQLLKVVIFGNNLTGEEIVDLDNVVKDFNLSLGRDWDSDNKNPEW